MLRVTQKQYDAEKHSRVTRFLAEHKDNTIAAAFEHGFDAGFYYAQNLADQDLIVPPADPSGDPRAPGGADPHEILERIEERNKREQEEK